MQYMVSTKPGRINLSERSKATDLILNERAHGIGKLIQISYAGEIPSIDGMCGRNIIVISGKNTDDSDSAVQHRTHLGSRIQDRIVFTIIHIMTVLTELDDVMRTSIG